MPLRVSGVPPDLLVTITRVLLSRSLRRMRIRSIPAGSVLSIKWIDSGGKSAANASSTNCGPSAEPPIPIESISVNRGALGG